MKIRRLALALLLFALPMVNALAMQSASGNPGAATAPFPVPFMVGEKLDYNVHFGPLRVGHGSMEVMGIVPVRGRDTWHTRLRVKGGIPLARVDDLFESWIDMASFNSLRFVQDLSELGRDRERHFEFFPDRKTFSENGKPEQPSVDQPLDDGSFLYFVRTVPLEVGKTYEFNRYFRPDRNPVTIKVLRRETITVPAGTFTALVLQPVIKTSKLFADGGQALIWLSDDSLRIMVQMKTKLSFGSLSLYLTSLRLSPAEIP
ncbi:MAG: hypothetical protein MNPFHGCM_01298 [Gemmatimonadaceae bacterium]|nr:hypothetical protein [Gemmatimonadaceae bacterium]